MPNLLCLVKIFQHTVFGIYPSNVIVIAVYGNKLLLFHTIQPDDYFALSRDLNIVI